MAKSPRKAEPAIPVSDELIPIAMKASPDAGGEGSDVQPAAAEAPFNALRMMEGKAGAEYLVPPPQPVKIVTKENDANAKTKFFINFSCAVSLRRLARHATALDWDPGGC